MIKDALASRSPNQLEETWCENGTEVAKCVRAIGMMDEHSPHQLFLTTVGNGEDAS